MQIHNANNLAPVQIWSCSTATNANEMNCNGLRYVGQAKINRKRQTGFFV